MDEKNNVRYSREDSGKGGVCGMAEANMARSVDEDGMAGNNDDDVSPSVEEDDGHHPWSYLASHLLNRQHQDT